MSSDVPADRHRRRTDARVRIAGAIEVFDRLGAEPLHRRAQREQDLTGSPGHRGSPESGEVNRLTAQEQRVAQVGHRAADESRDRRTTADRPRQHDAEVVAHRANADGVGLYPRRFRVAVSAQKPWRVGRGVRSEHCDTRRRGRCRPGLRCLARSYVGARLPGGLGERELRAGRGVVDHGHVDGCGGLVEGVGQGIRFRAIHEAREIHEKGSERAAPERPRPSHPDPGLRTRPGVDAVTPGGEPDRRVHVRPTTDGRVHLSGTRGEPEVPRCSIW